MRIPILILGASLVLAACEDSTGPAGEGELRVTVTTTGGDPDLDGYVLDVDGRAAFPLGPTVQTTLRLSVGRHVLELEGVAQNCDVQGDSRREITVPASGVVTLALAIECEATGVRVTAPTTGLDFDLNGYQVLVDGTHRAIIGANSSATVSRLEPGPHEVAIADLSGNCQLVGPASQTVTVADREVTSLGFAVTCVATTGVIRVEVTTTGLDRDVDGYRALLNGQGTNAVLIRAPSMVGHLARVYGGTQFVTLEDFAANCAIVGDAAPTAVVTVGGLVRDTAVVNFTVDCALDSGTIHVTTTVTGDAMGSQLTVHAYCTSDAPDGCRNPSPDPVPLAADGSSTLTARSNSYSVFVDSYRCWTPSASVEVTPGSEHEVHFDVTCGPPIVQITATTSGPMADTEYRVSVWEPYYSYFPIDQRVLPANGAVSVELPFSGYFQVVIEDVAGNCTAAPSYSHFHIGFGQTVNVQFTVVCTE